MLSAGTRLGPYEVVSPLGAGGMGEVYRARDTRLGREVAVKVLPAAYLADAGRLERFEREARASSALEHPNILVLYDVGVHDGVHYLVTELLEGEPLRSLLSRGRLPTRTVVEYALQIAQGLQAAHEKGIVHRDLKPENLFVTSASRVKILDFGLARLGPAADARESAEGPTNTAATDPGVVLGTAGYMSPEQVHGQPASARSDVFSLGTVLYEMFSGQRAFRGASPAECLSAILREDPPDLAAVGVSPAIDRVVRRCLEKSPGARFHSAHDVGLALEAAALAGDRSGATTAVAPPAPRGSSARLVPLLATLVLGALAGWLARGPGRSSRLVRLMVPVGDLQLASLGQFPRLAISRDGRMLAYSDRRLLNVRSLDRFEAIPLAGTAFAVQPVFSPDARFVAYRSFGAGIRKVAATGGPVVTVLETAIGSGLDWGEDDRLYFSAGLGGGGIFRVSAGGGSPEAVTRVDDQEMENSHVYPQLLPGGRELLFTVLGPSMTDLDARVVVQTLASGERKTLAQGAAFGRVLASGHLLFTRRDTIFAAGYDAGRQELLGTPVPVLSGVHVAFWSGSASYAISEEGTLAFTPPLAGPEQVLRLVDRSGRDLAALGPARWVDGARFSPDGRRIAVSVRDRSQHDVWTYGVASGQGQRFTFDPAEDESPVWSGDGRSIAYTSAHTGQTRRIFVKAADGSGEPRLLRAWPRHLHLTSWSPDGRWLVGYDFHQTNGTDIWAIPTDGSEPVPVETDGANSSEARISPDGRWLAYQSDETGTLEVYVVSFPKTGDKRQVSTKGGALPRWDGSGRALYLLEMDGRLMSLPVATGGGFSWGSPTVLMERRVRGFDVAPDGSRFVIEITNPAIEAPPIHVATGWFGELRRLLAPAASR